MKGTKPQLAMDRDAIRKAPPAPAWLSEEAKKEWRRVIPILVSRKILTVADLGSLENYCVAIGQVREMEEHLQRHGHVVEQFKDKDGEIFSLGMKRNPAVGIQADAMTRARLLAAELGLTPVSRSRPAIREDEDDGDDPLNIS
ncbi:phage terminase small subunit P27 family [Rhizobium sp. YJ-22]|uniref:phage terminase small subunit P27 family n=1 Tax=Rhizobium sp. YJ-22 TaxID=3037556 RepID=UPI002412A682|nr:phage terminase small subunit P27 family [Rhizobium sp. YJ-22]MDG3575729.1 phage terminase small subunit P27 family [Rhizobium sp. YJ-22]